jgi:uncharacterized Zn finger protein
LYTNNIRIPLATFEEYIPERKILYRGLDYFQNDYISSREDNGLGNFSFSVEGTEMYTVLVQLNEEQQIISCSCDCPYDQGNLCKHEIACFFFLQEKLSKDKKS